MKQTNLTHASALDLHDQLHAIMDRLEPVMIELAGQPGVVGDGVAEEQIIQQLDHAIEALWSYLQHPKRRESFRIAPVPPGLERLDGDGGGLHREGGADAAGCVTTSQPAEVEHPAPRDDHSQDNPPAEDISIDIELPEPQTAKA